LGIASRLAVGVLEADGAAEANGARATERAGATDGTLATSTPASTLGGAGSTVLEQPITHVHPKAHVVAAAASPTSRAND
jgi:hypothetical protein